MTTIMARAAPRTIPSIMGVAAGSGDRAVGLWLLACALLVWAMVVMGGVTRLTRSGLSIVRWEPIAGALLPRNEQQWERELALYRASPEGTIVNAGLDLAGFKRIYLIEWSHRQLGRMTGLVVLGPLLWFGARGRLRGGLRLRVAGVFALGVLQAALGWYMVKSGLVAVPVVSPYRLLAHLVLAVVIFAALLWLALGELRGAAARASPAGARPQYLTLVLLLLLVVTIAFGALVAGMHAGGLYPTFPSFHGRYLPAGLRFDWPSLSTSAPGVHFMHRACALLTAVCGLVASLRSCLRPGRPGEAKAALMLLVLLALQVVLGALTVLRHVPVTLAALHQAHAILVLAGALVLSHVQLQETN